MNGLRQRLAREDRERGGDGGRDQSRQHGGCDHHPMRRHPAYRQRTALELQFQDCSYSEIAAELRMTPKAAKSLLYRARLQLRENLNPFMTAEV